MADYVCSLFLSQTQKKKDLQVTPLAIYRLEPIDMARKPRSDKQLLSDSSCPKAKVQKKADGS